MDGSWPEVRDEVEWIRMIQEAYGSTLFVFAYRATNDAQTAEEIVQDTLVRAWRHADRFDPDRGSLQRWLFSIARNLVIDRHRRSDARPRTVADLDAVDETHLIDQGAIDRALEAWQVAEALRRLTPEHREVILESYYRGGSVAETADRLNIPQGTVKSRLYYALRALRLVLEEMGVVS